MFLFEGVDFFVVREKALLVAVGRKREKFLFIQGSESHHQRSPHIDVRIATQSEAPGCRTMLNTVNDRLHNLVGVALDRKCAVFETSPYVPGGRVFVGSNQGRSYQPVFEARFGSARFDKSDFNSKMCNFLSQRVTKAFNGPLGGVIKAEVRIGGLTAR